MTDHWQVIEGCLEGEISKLTTESTWWEDGSSMQKRILVDLKDHEDALAFVREQRTQAATQQGWPQLAMTQYLKGHTTIVATRDEWNQRYTDGWKDGYDALQEDGPQLCQACLGDGEVEDYSHLSPPVEGDWPMVTCPRCSGTGLEPQPTDAAKDGGGDK